MFTKLDSGTFWIVLSVLLALLLSLVPLPYWASWFRPEWLLLVVIYWAMALPHRVSIGSAWCLGLLLDALNGTLLGEHALAFSIVAYVTVKLHLRIRLFPLWQQALSVLGLVYLYQLVLFIIQGVIGQLPTTLWYWLPTLSSMLFWPWTYLMLRNLRRRFKIV